MDDASGAMCCGGECLVSQTTMGTGSTSTTTETTTLGPTTMSQSSSSDGSSSETTRGEMLCGNGQVDPGEDCDDDNPNCVDCSFAQSCGNGVIDPEDDELCDPWMPGDGESCDETCRVWTAFAWDEDSANEDTERDFPVLPCPLRDATCIDWGSDLMGPRRSGDYFPSSMPTTVTGWPEALLLSRPISFPALTETDTVTINVRHGYDFNFDDPTYADHAIIALVPEGQLDNVSAWVRVLPMPASTDAESIACGGPAENCLGVETPPFCDQGIGEEAFAGVRDMGPSTRDIAGDLLSEGTFQLAFRVRYDCQNFQGSPDADDAWRIQSARVVVERG